uniref:non-specific serine/threonine protein kinase n=1 Tax=Sexangularia sp. CB-2014 TaxID=1486929 RepID=A0A7S1V7X3_9EUKA
MEKHEATIEIKNETFTVGRLIGRGSFGDVRLGAKCGDGVDGSRIPSVIAIKLEETKEGNQLELEAKVYKTLSGVTGFPDVYAVGEAGAHRYMAMQLLGPSLEDLFSFSGRRFSTKTLCMIALQLLRRIEFLHSKSIVHRDLKSANVLMGGAGDEATLYVIDFGLAKHFRNPTTHKHVAYRDECGNPTHMTGTARFASINTHLGMAYSRRDDIESLGYLLVYFWKGSLPWQNVEAMNRDRKYVAICDKKMNTPLATLCAGCPAELRSYVAAALALGFDEKPDYSKYRKLFEKLLTRKDKTFDGNYDWNLFDAPERVAADHSQSRNGTLRSVLYKKMMKKT